MGRLLLGGSRGYTDSKVIGSYEVSKMGYNDFKLFGTLLGNLHRIKLRLDVLTELGSLYGFFDGSNDGLI